MRIHIHCLGVSVVLSYLPRNAPPSHITAVDMVSAMNAASVKRDREWNLIVYTLFPPITHTESKQYSPSLTSFSSPQQMTCVHGDVRQTF